MLGYRYIRSVFVIFELRDQYPDSRMNYEGLKGLANINDLQNAFPYLNIHAYFSSVSGKVGDLLLDFVNTQSYTDTLIQLFLPGTSHSFDKVPGLKCNTK
jgi:hypothetical protein